MHSLRVAAQRDCLIGDEVMQACPGNGLKGDLPAEVRRERDRGRLDRLENLAGDEGVAALGLALDRELKRDFLGERAREFEKLGRFAALELQFHLAKRRGLTACLDLSLFDREVDLAVSALDRIAGAAHTRLENRLQAAPHGLAEHGFEGAVLCDVELGLAAADLVLPLVAGNQYGAFAGFLLYYLNMAPADAPHPQR